MHVDLQRIFNIFTYSIYSFTMSLDKDACHYYCINQFVQLFPMGIHKWDTAIDCFSRKSIEKGQLSSHNVFSFIINCKWVTCSWFKHCFFFIFMRPIIWIDQQVVSYVFNFSHEIPISLKLPRLIVLYLYPEWFTHLQNLFIRRYGSFDFSKKNSSSHP